MFNRLIFGHSDDIVCMKFSLRCALSLLSFVYSFFTCFTKESIVFLKPVKADVANQLDGGETFRETKSKSGIIIPLFMNFIYHYVKAC